MADFGLDQRSSESLKGRRNFLVRWISTISPISVGQISRNLKTTTSIGVAIKTFGTEFWKFYRKRSFLKKQRKNFWQNFNVLRLQTDMNMQWLQIARNSVPNDPYTVSIFPFESIQNMCCMLRTKNLSKFSATSDVRYWVNQVRCCAAWLTDMEEKRKLETENK